MSDITVTTQEISDIPDLAMTPHKITEELDKYIIGQDDAKTT